MSLPTPSRIIFFIVLIISTIISISSYSWLSIWVGLETNLLMFTPLLSVNKTQPATEASIKYFLTQALASIILLASLSIISHTLILPLLIKTLFLSSLAVKLGIAPFHFWFPLVINASPWLICLILRTWQKIAPIILLIIAPLSFSINILFSLIVTSRAVLGAINGLNQTQLRPLLAYSSINHIAWIIYTLFLSKPALIIYFRVYIINSALLILTFNFSSSFSPHHLASVMSSYKILIPSIIIGLLSLAGLPPLLGFAPKWLIIEISIQHPNTLPVIILLITSSLITAFFYLNLIFTTLLNVKFIYKPTCHPPKFYTALSIISIITLALPFIIFITYALIFLHQP